MNNLSLHAQAVALKVIRIIAAEQCSVKDARAALAYIDKTIESNAVVPECMATLEPGPELEKFFD